MNFTISTVLPAIARWIYGLLIVEYEKRLAIFQDNLKEIAILEKNEEGTATYAVNDFADISSKFQSIRDCTM